MQQLLILLLLFALNAFAEEWKDIDPSFDRNPTERWIKEVNDNKDEARAWITLLGYKAGDYYKVVEFKKAGINSPKEALKWHKAGISYTQLTQYTQSGVNSAAEALTWKKSGVYPYELNKYKSLGFKDGQQYLELKKYLGSSNAFSWAKVGIIDLDVVKSWIDIGFSKSDYYTIGKIKQAGINSQEFQLAIKELKLPASANSITKVQNFLNNNKNITKLPREVISNQGDVKIKVPKSKQPSNTEIDEKTLWKSVGVTSQSIINNFNKYKIKPNTINTWKQAGFSINDIERWAKAGVVKPLEAEEWKKLNIYDSAVTGYVKKGILTPSQFKDMYNLVGSHSNVESWANKGITNPKELKKWLDLGLSSVSSSNAKEFMDIGFTADEIKKIITSMGITNISNKYLEVLQVAKDLKSGKTNLETAGAWGKLDLEDYNIERYKSAGLNPEQIDKWAQLLLKYGYNNYKPEVVNKENLKRIMNNADREIINWYKTFNGNINNAKLFLSNDIKNISKAKSIVESNIDLVTILDWKKRGFLKDGYIGSLFIEQLTPWYKNSFTPEEATKWKDNNIHDVNKALHYKKLGLTPEEAKAYPEWITDNKNALTLVKSVKKSCGILKTYEDVVMHTPANKQKDTCFSVKGNLIGKIDGYPAFNNYYFETVYKRKRYRIPYVLMSENSSMFSSNYPKIFDQVTQSEQIGAIVKLDGSVGTTPKNMFVKLFVLYNSKELY